MPSKFRNILYLCLLTLCLPDGSTGSGVGRLSLLLSFLARLLHIIHLSLFRFDPPCVLMMRNAIYQFSIYLLLASSRFAFSSFSSVLAFKDALT